ncbi:MAG: hypothetical protein JSV23_01520 [Promethearchaeota archaeon]|nr:MAG: hypothetical protein JSV23_01520 [Candidatus Lokiarchaeota archaeon]
MKDQDIILGLFYADEDNLIFDNIKYSENFSDMKINDIKMLSYKFLGPVFLTAATGIGNNWIIEFVEASLSVRDTNMESVDVLQSFFTLNSSIEIQEGTTNLFALISTPYTEDIKFLYDEISNYIHPSIVQGKIVNENLLRSRFDFNKLINSELERGINLIEYSLGGSRKVYWEEEQRYYCVGLIERKNAEDLRISNLYTFDKDDPLRKAFLNDIPSYYVLAILPDYYEHLIGETLDVYNKMGVYPNIRMITLRYRDRKVVYLEEYIVEHKIYKSYGAILVQQNEKTEENKKLSYFKKNLRLILDRNKALKESLELMNPHFKNERWGAISNEELDKIGVILDNPD